MDHPGLTTVLFDKVWGKVLVPLVHGEFTLKF